MSKKMFFLLLAGTVLLTESCKKSTDVILQPVPGTADTTSYIRFTANGIQQSGNQVYALLSIKNSNGQPVITDRKVTLDNIQGHYLTDRILLEKGEYKLVKFIVLSASDSAIYAAPKTGTTYASQVAQPLDLSFSVSTAGVTNAAVQVLKVQVADNPDQFGYNNSDFGFISMMTLKAKLKVTVGQVLYDSLPGTIIVTATRNASETWIREMELSQGASQIQVPAGYDTYRFEMRKWNLTDTRTFDKTAVQQGMTINLEASREPLRLIEELTFIENTGGVIPESRVEYFYNSQNRLQNIKSYQRSLQVSGLHLTSVYDFIYQGGLLDTISRFDAASQPTGYTAFTYEDGRISAIANQSYDQFTGAAFHYSQSGGQDIIKGDYIFQNGGSMNYEMRFRNGNKVYEQALSSTMGGESGVYEYDTNINPKHQLGFHDMYFTNSSRNNLAGVQKGYGGAIPQVIPYKYEYVYNTEGYPSEAYISYKGYTSQQHLYRIKKVYKYQ